MKKYIIDGNNLIGKLNSLTKIQKKDKQNARVRLAFMVERFFSSKKIEVFLHFDGFENQKINTQKTKIIYSQNIIADEKIKSQIEKEDNKRNLIIVSSDKSIIDFARVCSCAIVSCEGFSKQLTKSLIPDEEEKRIKAINDIESYKKLFNFQ